MKLEFGNVDGLADHQRAGQCEHQHKRVKLPWTDLDDAEPQRVTDVPKPQCNEQNDHENQARRNRRAFELLDLTFVTGQRFRRDVKARQATDTAAHEVTQDQPIPTALHAARIT